MSDTEVNERASSIYTDMMEILERRGDDKAVVRNVLTAMLGAYLRFMEENHPEVRLPRPPSTEGAA